MGLDLANTFFPFRRLSPFSSFKCGSGQDPTRPRGVNEVGEKREERRDRREELINNINKQTTNNTIHPIIFKSFSMSLDEDKLLKDFCEVARREAGKRGFSTTIVQAMREYVLRHGRGNTAMKLINYCDPSTQSPYTHLCNFSKGARNDGHVFCSNPSIVKSHDAFILHSIQGNWLNGVTCYSCIFNKLRKR